MPEKKSIILLRRDVEKAPLISFNSLLPKLNTILYELKTNENIVISHEDFLLGKDNKSLNLQEWCDIISGIRGALSKQSSFLVHSVVESSWDDLHSELVKLEMFSNKTISEIKKVFEKQSIQNTNTFNPNYFLCEEFCQNLIKMIEDPNNVLSYNFNMDISKKNAHTFLNTYNANSRKKQKIAFSCSYFFESSRFNLNYRSDYCSFKIDQVTSALRGDSFEWKDEDINNEKTAYFGGYPKPFFDFGEKSTLLRVCADHTVFTSSSLEEIKRPIFITSNSMSICETLRNVIYNGSEEQVPEISTGLSFLDSQENGFPEKIILNKKKWLENVETFFGNNVDKIKLSKGIVSLFTTSPYIVYSNPVGKRPNDESHIYYVSSITHSGEDIERIEWSKKPSNVWLNLGESGLYQYKVYEIEV